MPKARGPRRQTTHSNTYRFFVAPDALQGRDVQIDNPDLAHQLSSVLRLQPGNQVLLLDNTGWQYTIALQAIERGRVLGSVERKELAPGEPRTKVTLYTALIRPDRFELVLQKGTELGVVAFVPLICERSAVGDTADLSERKLERWRRIIREAAEQSCRGKLPRLATPLAFAAACEQAARRETAILLWEGGNAASLRQTLRSADADSAESDTQTRTASPFSIAVFSGPEGGFTAGEFEAARSHAITPVTLGPRTLRAETAPLAAAAAILYDMGDLE